MIEILLTQGLVSFVDETDADLAEKKWYPKRDRKSKTVYVTANNWVNGKNRTISLHRIIFSRVIGRELTSSEKIDHINLNGLDNRRENLRLTTPTLNRANTGKRSDNTSGYKGVSWHQDKKAWSAKIAIYGKQYHLGYFNNPQDAHRAYCEKADELFGKFARYK